MPKRAVDHLAEARGIADNAIKFHEYRDGPGNDERELHIALMGVCDHLDAEIDRRSRTPKIPNRGRWEKHGDGGTWVSGGVRIDVEPKVVTLEILDDTFECAGAMYENTPADLRRLHDLIAALRLAEAVLREKGTK